MAPPTGWNAGSLPGQKCGMDTHGKHGAGCGAELLLGCRVRVQVRRSGAKPLKLKTFQLLDVLTEITNLPHSPYSINWQVKLLRDRPSYLPLKFSRFASISGTTSGKSGVNMSTQWWYTCWNTSFFFPYNAYDFKNPSASYCQKLSKFVHTT